MTRPEQKQARAHAPMKGAILTSAMKRLTLLGNSLGRARPTFSVGRLARDTLSMSASTGLRSMIQSAVFLIVARMLGVADYGAYAAIMALSSTFGCFTGWGTHSLLVRDVSRDPSSYPGAWGRALGAIAVSAPALLALYLTAAWALLPAGVSYAAIIIIGVADIVLAPIALFTAVAYQGHDRIEGTASLSLMATMPRIAGAIVLIPLTLVISPEMRLTAWSLLYAASAMVAVHYSLRKALRELGAAHRPTWRSLLGSIREGLTFALSGAALKIYTDIDKTMLARLAATEAAGAYSAGYRIMELATVPVLSLMTTALPRFFRIGEQGLPAAIAYSYSLLPFPVIYTILSGLVLFLCAGILPVVLGSTFLSAVPVLQWLAWLPLVSLPRLFFQTVLACCNRQTQALGILVSGCMLNIMLNLWMIPAWGWPASVAATYAAELAMAVAMYAAVNTRTRDTKPPGRYSVEP
jgi:O-antigen/teichoic acid export membrane protein